MKQLSEEFLDNLGRSRDWVDYPTDSIEQGDTWHCEPERAPFGRIWDKECFNETMQSVYEKLQEFPELAHKVLEDKE